MESDLLPCRTGKGMKYIYAPAHLRIKFSDATTLTRKPSGWDRRETPKSRLPSDKIQQRTELTRRRPIRIPRARDLLLHALRIRPLPAPVLAERALQHVPRLPAQCVLGALGRAPEAVDEPAARARAHLEELVRDVDVRAGVQGDVGLVQQEGPADPGIDVQDKRG